MSLNVEVYLKGTDPIDGAALTLYECDMDDFYEICSEWETAMRCHGIMFIDVPVHKSSVSNTLAIPADVVHHILARWILDDETETDDCESGEEIVG